MINATRGRSDEFMIELMIISSPNLWTFRDVPASDEGTYNFPLINGGKARWPLVILRARHELN